LEKSGLRRDGALAIIVLMVSNASFSNAVFLNYMFFLIIFCKGFTISTKSGTNLLTKLIMLKNDCMDLLLCGGEISRMDLVLSRSTEISYLEITFPNKIPSKIVNIVFLVLREIPYFLHYSKIYFRCFGWSSLFLE
jgi:hypothetical protein